MNNSNPEFRVQLLHVPFPTWGKEFLAVSEVPICSPLQVMASQLPHPHEALPVFRPYSPQQVMLSCEQVGAVKGAS